MSNNVREVAFQITHSVLFHDAYSNILLQSTHLENPSDQGLLTEIVYGTLQNFLRYEKMMEEWDPEKRFTQRARVINAISLYQIEYLDRVPAYAIYAEATKLAKHHVRKEEKRIYAFLQATPRTVLLEKKAEMKAILEKKDVTQMTKKERNEFFEVVSIYYSFPKWICQLVYGQSKSLKTLFEYLEYHNTRPQTTLRVRDQFIEEVSHMYELQDACMFVEGNPIKHPLVIEKKAVIQDRASQQLRHFLPSNKPCRILDMCASPGGKSVLAADFYHDEVPIVANDIHAHKIERMETYFSNLGLSNIETNLSAGEQLRNQYMSGTFDLILLDAPCSGLGVIRRRPEIRYRITPEALDSLSTIQSELLKTAYSLLSDDGICIYSTCTINKKENGGHFEQDTFGFICDGEPFDTYGMTTQSDGFYIQRLKK